ncbi:hypothetical protein BBF96_08980 [Anoxybacter fermentans]|uniref:Major facilitator superfamily (MFS) profile domain-containing protein n=1 Tax=Anoxybacter fermentans TaxID=1323375 RepID=A0A3S9SYT1_9FIRM|nr:MFS transporter [Anoxybacter fermentans]AZR73506.1 hypothetical protein BBF96_08980 [Anoxybacter fermentans]
MKKKPEGFNFFYTTRLLSVLFDSLTGPFWVVYFYNLGIDAVGISLMLMANHIAITVFEIPTGAVADFLGRKTSVFLSLLLSGITFTGIYFTDNFIFILLLYSLCGVAATFMSGAFHAWFVDSMQKAGEEDLTEWWGHLTSGRQIGSILGYLIGSGLTWLFGIRILWIISGIGSLILAFYVLSKGKEINISVANKSSFKKYCNIVLEGTTYLFKRKLLFILIFSSFVWFISTGIFALTWQPYFKEQEIDPKYFGIIMTVYMCISIPILKKAGALSRKAKGELTIIQIIGVLSGVITVTMVFVNKLAWIPYILYGAVYSLKDPIFQGYINKLIPSSVRSTVLSTYNLLISLATIVSSIIFGIVGKYFGFKALFISSAVVCLLMVLIVGYAKTVEKNQVANTVEERTIENG